MKRMDERGQHPTPSADTGVRDGRQLMSQEDWDYFGTEVRTKELTPGVWRLDFERYRRVIAIAQGRTDADAAEARRLMGVA
jgi:hypothetical protein